MERDKEIQKLCELKMPQALPGYSGGALPGRSKAEGGKEGKAEEGEVRRVEKEAMNAILTAGPACWPKLRLFADARRVGAEMSDGVAYE